MIDYTPIASHRRRPATIRDRPPPRARTAGGVRAAVPLFRCLLSGGTPSGIVPRDQEGW